MRAPRVTCRCSTRYVHRVLQPQVLYLRIATATVCTCLCCAAVQKPTTGTRALAALQAHHQQAHCPRSCRHAASHPCLACLPSEPHHACAHPARSCSKFKQLFSRIAGEPQWRVRRAAQSSPFLVKVAALNASSVNAMLTDPRAVRAVLLRDPVKRFLSAYANKVVRLRCEALPRLAHSCGNYTLSPDGVARFMRDYPQWIGYDHMVPQVNFCGFRAAGFNDKHVWNRVGVYDPSTIARVASQLFDGRLDAPMSGGWDGLPERGMWDAKTDHALPSHDATLFRQSMCANGTMLATLRRALAEDYDFFQLPEPDLCPKA